MDVLFLYSSVCKSDNHVLSSEYIHRNLSTAQYALQNLEPYHALVIETKRNQKLFQFRFRIQEEIDLSESKNEVLSDEMKGLELQSPRPETNKFSCKSETSVELLDNDMMVLD